MKKLLLLTILLAGCASVQPKDYCAKCADSAACEAYVKVHPVTLRCKVVSANGYTICR